MSTFVSETTIGALFNQNINRFFLPIIMLTLVNDTFLITQNLILSVIDTVAGSPLPVNWQCRFVSVKMNDAEEAATNFKQFTISDE